MIRVDGRKPDQARRVVLDVDRIARRADGSVLACFGNTRVLCTATLVEGVPPFKKGTGEGWLTAEYAMLPASTRPRKQREIMKRDGRSVEIQRIIGRSLRAVLDFQALGENTVYIDCDVLEADGGTRTAAITGAYVALKSASLRWKKLGIVREDPVKCAVAAVSVGMLDREAHLDLCYQEDSRADVDMNLVMTERGEWVEVQGTGEGRGFTNEDLRAMMALGEEHIRMLHRLQNSVVDSKALSRKLVVATGNEGKLREIREIMNPYFDEILSMKDVGLHLDIVEDGDTFEQNAAIKARAVMDALGGRYSVLADDSGIMVDILGGAPGVHSARIAGDAANDKQRREKLKEMIRGKNGPFTARFVSAVCLARCGEWLAAHGECHGTILMEERGENMNGFGFDPLFYYEPAQKTFAEMSDVEKNAVSHRRRALDNLIVQLKMEGSV